MSFRLSALQSFGILAALVVSTGPVDAQDIPVKTVPVAAGDQFLIFPSRNLAMGGVSIALDDPLLDPFVNPAKRRQLRGTELFFAPTLYSISQHAGAARTLPAGLRFGSRTWFGGVAAAVQQIDSPRSGGCCVGILFDRLATGFVANPNLLSQRAHTNAYGFGTIGTRIPGTMLSLGASASWAELHSVDGVEHMYALSQRVDQRGYMGDFRLGLAGEMGGGRTFEALVLHSRFSMTHDVTYFDWVQDPIPGPWTQRTRVETNLDRTNTWGLHLGYVQPISHNGWRVGGIITTNRKSHPKIPNYEIMNIPRDPGTTWAYNMGVGVAKSDGPATFGLDLVVEPIWSHTWAETDTPLPLADGRTLPAGYHTIDNRFRFSNALVRMGAGRDVGRAGFQLGVQMRSIWYRLEQQDNVLDSYRQQTESWLEWTPTWGASVKFPEFEVRYLGRITTGTGRPGVAWTGIAAARLDTARAADIIVAPGGPLTLQEARVMTHQISISLPLR